MLDQDTAVAGDSELSAELSFGVGAKPLTRGDLVGRYVVLELLGSGGMGTVYAAFDPELDRKVAVKVLRAAEGSVSSGDAQTRLRREAQAMAQLRHPNVIQVYDVGDIEGRVFVAMEFINGQTLDDRIEAGLDDWDKVLALCVQAGRGLEASHAAGLVHRDFKPDNVMIDVEGRVVVMDYGLARKPRRLEGLDETAKEPGDSRGGVDLGDLDESVSRRSLADAELTQIGDLVGSPAYMAPEQFAGQGTDDRTDQFAFCLVTWEALSGEMAFGGDSVHARAFAVTMGKIKDPPADAAVPTRVWRALRRGLSVDPGDRWPSMGALLDELERDPGERARRHLAWIVPSAVALGLGAALWLRGPGTADDTQVCSGASTELAKTWDDGAREAVRGAFLASEHPLADDAARRVLARLDDYGARWSAAHAEACLAHERGEQSDRALDRRMGCLERRRASMGALVGVLSQGDPQIVTEAAKATSELPSLERCADVESLLTAVPPPEADAAEVAEVRDDLAQATALHLVGSYALAKNQLEALRRRGADTDYVPVQAEVELQLGITLSQLGEHDDSGEALERAFHLALQSGDDELAVRAAGAQATLVGYHQGHEEQGLTWMRHGRSLLSRVGQPPELVAMIHNSAGVLNYAKGDFATARAEHEEALRLRREALGNDHYLVAYSLSNLATIAYEERNLDEAVLAYREGIAVLEAALGDRHPTVAALLTNMGSVLFDYGKYAEAAAAHERALEIWQFAFGPDHPDVAFALNNLGNTHLMMGRYDDAVAHHRRALAIRRETYDRDHPLVASSVQNLGNAYHSMGETAKAEPFLREAVELFVRHHGEDHAETARARLNLGVFHIDRGDLSAARVQLDTAFAVESQIFGQDSERTVPVRLARIQLDRLAGDLDAALLEAQATAAILDGEVPEVHPDRASLHHELGMIAKLAGDDATARTELERARSLIDRLDGDHPSAASVDAALESL